ncbi:MAG: hypothetical protein ACRDRL_26845 [Sciscionella sp.]
MPKLVTPLLAAVLACGVLAGCSATTYPPPVTSSSTQPPKGFTDLVALRGDVRTAIQRATTAHWKLAGSALHGTGTIDLSAPSAPALAFDATGSSAQQFHTVLRGKDRYLKTAATAKRAKPWLKVTGTGPTAAEFGGILEQLADTVNPLTTLDTLGAVGTLRGSSPTRLDGQEVVEYHLSLDGATLAKREIAALGDGLPAKTKAKISTELKQLPDSVPASLWLDPNDRPVKVSITLNAHGASELSAANTVTYSDWGKPVDITAPPADEVAALPTGN